MSGSKVRVAVVGLGPIGNLHARIYRELEGAELVGVCDKVAALASAGSERHGVPGFTDVPAMLAGLNPTVVSVVTGGREYCGDHYEPTMQALEHGCHVLCEKPISDDLGKAREMVACARSNGLCFGIDFNHRFTPAAYAAKRWADAGELGHLLFCNMALWIGRPGEFETKNYHLKALNPHSVNLMTWFCGPVESVQAFATVAPGRNIWSTASINVRFESGAVGHLTSSYDIARAHSVERCEVAGTGGRLVIEDMWRRATLYPAASAEQRLYANPVFGGVRDFEDTFRERLGRFIAQVGAGAKPEEIDGSGEEGLASQTVIHGAIRSLDEGNRAVSISEL
ncbi:MAG TPA: Gfo/Idh/MocA family oxidoreductase [Fimbriimonadaceae bacterium]|nr:Gfo/Idh/MocA family oxidoreductase [Fimbriimonadaceae bacterium]